MVVFKFINCYVSLYYIAFLKDLAKMNMMKMMKMFQFAGRNALSRMEKKLAMVDLKLKPFRSTSKER